MKRLISLTLSAMILVTSLFAFAACGNGGGAGEKDLLTFYDRLDDGDVDITKYDYVDVKNDAGFDGNEGGFANINPLKSDKMAVNGFASFEKDRRFYRIDWKTKNSFSANVQSNAYNTAGGRVRFCTNSTKINITVKYGNYTYGYNHVSISGAFGIDVYVGTGTSRRWITTVKPNYNDTSVTATVNLYLSYKNSGYKEVTIELPTYAGIRSMSIGFDSGSKIAAPTPFNVSKPIVNYGSSTSHGGCISRPGNHYLNVLGRIFDADFINLGFNGSAQGEQAIADYIANIDMSCFILDYDDNSPTAETLRNTHYNMYKTVRDKNPDLPIIIVSRQWPYPGEDDARHAVIEATYKKAVEDGDKNVYFLDGYSVYGEYNRDLFTTDGVHQNDLGMYAMAKALYPTVKEVLAKQGYTVSGTVKR